MPDADPSREIAVAERRTHEGHAHMEAGRYEEAQTAFADALIRNPSAVGALVGLAQIHANQGRLVEAEAECRRALDVDVLSEDAHLLLALIYRQQDRTGAAIDHFEKVLYINVESIAGHFHLAELYRGQQRDVEAARQYRRALWALDRHPADGTVSGLPAGMVRRVCEAQLRRLKGTNST